MAICLGNTGAVVTDENDGCSGVGRYSEFQQRGAVLKGVFGKIGKGDTGGLGRKSNRYVRIPSAGNIEGGKSLAQRVYGVCDAAAALGHRRFRLCKVPQPLQQCIEPDDVGDDVVEKVQTLSLRHRPFHVIVA
ncbi:hypothetical protein GGE48_005530 [Rhizobium leguminosarum]|nr:hypothetical protein [Rhizobium leguminosarum]